MLMAMELEYYVFDERANTKTKIDSNYGFGSIFKGEQVRVPIAIYNPNDYPAVNPVASIMEFTMDENKDYLEAYKWKKLSLSKTMGYEQAVALPTIKPRAWMTGKDVYFENFSSYPPDSGVQPNQDWSLWAGSSKVWEIYSGYLQHNTDSMGGRACWNAFPKAKDFEFSMKITVYDSVFGGLILRDKGDYNEGYIVVVQGVSSYFPVGTPVGEGVIQVFKGKFTENIDKWTLLYQSPSIGVRGTHDYFKVKLQGNRFDFWYKNEAAPICSFVDPDFTYENASKPILCTHPGNGSTLIYFDDIRMEVENEEGLLWIQNTVDAKTKLFGTQYSVLDLQYGGVE